MFGLVFDILTLFVFYPLQVINFYFLLLEETARIRVGVTKTPRHDVIGIVRRSDATDCSSYTGNPLWPQSNLGK